MERKKGKLKCQLCMREITEKDNWVTIEPKRMSVTLDGETVNPNTFTCEDFHLDCGVQLLALMSGNRGGRFDWKVIREKMVQNW